MKLSFLSHRRPLLKPLQEVSQQRLDTQIERSESAFNVALEAEQRGNTAVADHFLNVAIEQEERAFK